MSINEVRYLPECGSTNAYVKEHFEEFGPVAAVYTENQTAGRGRLGRSWVNAEGKALYYTVAIKEPLAQPATLPLLASLAVRRQLQLRYGVDCQIKWPNDLLLNGKKIVGILCESVSYGYQQQGRGILCGIGINLAQPQNYFDAADLRAVAALDKFHVRPPYGVVQNVLMVAFRALFAAEGRVGRLFIADSVPSGACCSPVGVLEYRCQ